MVNITLLFLLFSPINVYLLKESFLWFIQSLLLSGIISVSDISSKLLSFKNNNFSLVFNLSPIAP